MTRTKLLTVLDLGPIARPDIFSLRTRFLWRLYLNLHVIDSTEFIVPSEFSKRELNRLVPRSRGRVSVIGLGADNFEVKQDEPIARHASEFLYLGQLCIKKGADLLLEATAQLASEGVPIKTSFVGDIGDLRAHSKALLSELVANGHASHSFAITDTELARRLKQATALVVPSRYEGFGLPIVEAYFLGVPVLASDIEVFREINGEKINYFRAESVADLARQINSFIQRKPELSRRDRSSVNMSWQSCGAQHLSVFDKLNGQSAGNAKV